MVKVLHIVNIMNRAGLETFIMNVYRNINRNQIQFDFLVHVDQPGDYDDEIKKLGGNIYSITSRRKSYMKNKKELKEFFKMNNHYDVVHMHVSSLSYIEPLIEACNAGVEIRIVHGHSSSMPSNFVHFVLHKFNQLRIENIATHMVSCSDLVSKWVFKKEKNVIKVNNGVDLKQFLFHESLYNSIREEMDLTGKLVVGHVGRFVESKNHLFIIDVFKELKSRHNNSVLLLVGDNTSPLNCRIMEKIESYGLRESVIITGVRNDIPQLLNSMDIFLFPSQYEGLPVTLVEAQSLGLPCFVSDTITKDVEITPIIKYLSLQLKPSLWAAKILEMNNFSRKSRNEYNSLVGRSGFDIKEVVAELESIYKSVKLG